MQLLYSKNHETSSLIFYSGIDFNFMKIDLNVEHAVYIYVFDETRSFLAGFNMFNHKCNLNE